jgi:hypothetical protein
VGGAYLEQHTHIQSHSQQLEAAQTRAGLIRVVEQSCQFYETKTYNDRRNGQAQLNSLCSLGDYDCGSERVSMVEHAI